MKDFCEKKASGGGAFARDGRLKKTFAALLTLILLLSFVAAPSVAKYVTEEKAPFGEEEQVDFTVNSVFLVNTADELFAAINQGYTYVQLDKEIENPLIITQKAENLNNDLILDLNGIEIQRNGYEPILNINEGVRLTIVDSSEEQTGGLYNPVGSVFNINGGTLTVVTGFFESGPRYSEYYSYNNEVLDNSTGSNTKRTLVESAAQNVNFYATNGSTSVIKNVPIIKSYPTKTGGVTYNHGNLYFDKAVTLGDFTIRADTYCYYRTSEDSALGVTDTSMANWHYSYYVAADTYNYVGADKVSETDVKVTIYGYEDVIKQASEKSDMKDYYAAIQMSSGSLEVQNGSFHQYFGVSTAACVNAQGGSITVNHGLFSSRVPNATVYSAGAVTEKESDKDAFGTAYFDNFNWDGGLAKGGESCCILNGGSATVKIGSGKLYSSNNSVVSMHGGELSITGGNFAKTLTNGLKTGADKAALAAVNMENGVLSVADSKFNVVGDGTYAIYSTVSGSDSFTVKNTDFSVKGEGVTGIYSSNGTVHMEADGSALISIEGTGGKGIFVENGGSVVSKKYNYTLDGDSSYGIYSTSGAIDMSGGRILLLSDAGCYGIYAASDDKITIGIDGSVIAIGCSLDGEDNPTFNSGDKTGTVAASVGVFLSSFNTESRLTLRAIHVYSRELGIVSDGGAIELYGEGSVVTDKASAIAIKNGGVIFDKDSDYSVTSKNTTDKDFKNSYEITLPTRNGTDFTNEIYANTDGIYVSGGSFKSHGNLNVTHTGLSNKTLSSGYSYSSLVVTSYAVRVYGGDVVIEKGTVTAVVGGGIYAGKSTDGSIKGSIVLGSEAQKDDTLSAKTDRQDIVRVYTEGKLVGDMYESIGTYIGDGWRSHQSITGGHAVELDGGNITIYNGIYEAQFGNGIFVNGSDSASEENGEINVYNGLFYGYMNAVRNNSAIDLSGKSGPSAFYGLKVVGGAVVKIYDGFFDGGNGGAFVTGVTEISSRTIQKSKTAYVYIYKGTFGSSDGNLDAFNVYDDVKIVFGAYGKAELDNMYTDAKAVSEAIKLNSTETSIAVNAITYSSYSKHSDVYVYYGSYNGKMYIDPNMDATYYTYNTSVGDGSGNYTVCTGDVKGNQNNGTAVWFSGSFN